MMPILAQFSAGHLNTALVPVCWDLIEPEEGKFDFRLVDGAIAFARGNHLRLILLWFGSRKNGVSTYAPVWVQRDLKRFPRAQNQEGKRLEILSTLSDANRDADARAFAALMRRVREIDGDAHTVLVVQVENEVGVLSETRDRSAAANEAFEQPAPAELMTYLAEHKDKLSPAFRGIWEAGGCKTSGSWQEIFGVGETTDEIFMEWHYVRYMGHLANAGKAEYPLPMFVTGWLAYGRETASLRPGDYPSGGPVPYMMDIWKAGAPQIDVIAPDIHSYVTERRGRYRRSGNPPFIPETKSYSRRGGG